MRLLKIGSGAAWRHFLGNNNDNSRNGIFALISCARGDIFLTSFFRFSFFYNRLKKKKNVYCRACACGRSWPRLRIDRKRDGIKGGFLRGSGGPYGIPFVRFNLVRGALFVTLHFCLIHAPFILFGFPLLRLFY